MQFKIEETHTACEVNEPRDVITNHLTREMIFDVGNIMTWPLPNLYIFPYLRIESEANIFIFDTNKIIERNLKGICKLSYMGDVCLEGSITHSKCISWVWEPDINYTLFDIGGLIKTDAMFVLDNPQVEKFENCTPLWCAEEEFAHMNK